MKKILILVFLILISFKSYADFNSGHDAYEDGDYATALREWQPLAKAGDIDAQAMLGQMYLYGEGVPKDEEISSKWFKLAASKGDSVSQNFIGVAYELGIGVTQNYKIALRWYKLSAEKKDRYTDDQIQMDSLYYLGNMYKYGRGVPINSIVAHMWFNIAASLGDNESTKIKRELEIKMDSNEILLAKKLAKQCKLLNYKCAKLYEDIVAKNDAKYSEAIRNVQIEQEQLKEKKKFKVEEAELERILLILKKQEAKKKVEEQKRVADAKKLEEKRKLAEEKRVADAKKAEEKRIFEKKRIAQEKLNKKLSLLPPITELKEAQNFLSDFQVYIGSNPDEFDFFEIVKLIQNTKLISEGISDDRQLKNIGLFKEFIKSSSTFLEFQKNSQNERVKSELIKLDILIDQVNSSFIKLKSFSKDNLSSTLTNLLDEKIKSSQLIIINPKTFAELEGTKKDLESFLSELRVDIRKTIAAKSENNKIINDSNVQLKKIDENISDLKTYYLANSQILSTDLTDLIVEKVTLLQKIKDGTSLDNNREELIELLKVNKEIYSFRLNNDLLTSGEIKAIKKQAEEKKKVEEKKKAEERKRKVNDKEVERLRNFKTVNMNCTYYVDGQYLSYSWSYDGKKLYWEGVPIKIGRTSVDETITIKVNKLFGKDKFHININIAFLAYDFENDFYNQDSVIDLLGMKAFGSCY